MTFENEFRMVCMHIGYGATFRTATEHRNPKFVKIMSKHRTWKIQQYKEEYPELFL